jgi:hypothetical protein
MYTPLLAMAKHAIDPPHIILLIQLIIVPKLTRLSKENPLHLFNKEKKMAKRNVDPEKFYELPNISLVIDYPDEEFDSGNETFDNEWETYKPNMTISWW